MSPIGQGPQRALAAQFHLSMSLFGFTKVIIFLLILRGSVQAQKALVTPALVILLLLISALQVRQVSPVRRLPDECSTL